MFGVLVVRRRLPRRAATTTLDASSTRRRRPRSAGLQPGDTLVAVDGAPIADWDELRPRSIEPRRRRPSTFTVERDGERRRRPGHARDDRGPDAGATDGQGFLGVGAGIASATSCVLGSRCRESRRDAAAGRDIAGDVGRRARQIVLAVGHQRATAHVLTADTDASRSRRTEQRFVSLVGIVGTVAITSAADRLGRGRRACCSRSTCSSALFNLLPLLPFDGGHIAIATYEKIASTVTRRRVQVDVAQADARDRASSWPCSLFIFLSSLFLDIRTPARQPVLSGHAGTPGDRAAAPQDPPGDGRDRCRSAATRRSRCSR